MNKIVFQKFIKIIINENSSVKNALEQMDNSATKLLIVANSHNEYVSLLSIGDIQRHLIKNQDFDSNLTTLLRKNVTVANQTTSRDEIKTLMHKFRTEFMPILNEENELVDVMFWEELFEDKQNIQGKNIDCPVIIMAGGKGTRLQPITHIIPKPLVPVGDKPIIQRIMDQFIDAGCTKFTVSTGYKANMLKSYFKDVERQKYDISYYSEDKPMGTAGSLSLIKDQIDSTFFVSNCDIIIEQNYSDIYKYHKSNKNELTAVAFVKNMQIPYGTFEVGENGILNSLIEKPSFTFLVNAGMYILEPHLLEEIPENSFFHITHLMQNIIKRNGKVGVFPISEGSWLDIGQWKEYQKTLKKYGAQIEI